VDLGNLDFYILPRNKSIDWYLSLSLALNLSLLLTLVPGTGFRGVTKSPSGRQSSQWPPPDRARPVRASSGIGEVLWQKCRDFAGVIKVPGGVRLRGRLT
jgi:hypothetical protein